MIQIQAQLNEELQKQPSDKERIRRLKDDRESSERLLRTMGQSVDRMKVRPGSPMRQRVKQARRESGNKAVIVLGLVLNVTYFAV